MVSILPDTDKGYLPYFLLFDGLAALIHSVVCYLSPPSRSLAFRGTSAPPPTTLLAHTYGVKNMYTGAIRLYAAYRIGAAQKFGIEFGRYATENRPLYDLSILTFVGVLVLYGGERFVWRTVRDREAVFPLVMAGFGLIWMVMQRGALSFLNMENSNG